MLLVYKKPTPAELEEGKKEVLDLATKFFADHPDRQECKAKVWDGQIIVLHRGRVQADIDIGAQSK